MDDTAYIDRLKSSRTYPILVARAETYKYQFKFNGLLRLLPPSPQANTECDVIILDSRNNCPTIWRVLSQSDEPEPLTTRDIGKVIVYLHKKQKSFKVTPPPSGYRLGDDEPIDADIEFEVQITNAQEFWEGGDDPIGVLEKAAIAETERYFLDLSGFDLVARSSNASPTVNLNNVKDGLARRLHNLSVAGLNIGNVTVEVRLPDYLKAFFARQNEKTWGQGGSMDNQY